MATLIIPTSDFYNQPVLDVARNLLGKKLVRIFNGERVSGMIYEVEAYDGEQDRACHARAGRTNRNSAMYGPPGQAYIYFTYGMHWMLNCVCGAVGYPAAVLIRALIPQEGLEQIAQNREGIHPSQWCNGPAKLTRALKITNDFNKSDLTDKNAGLFVEEFENIPDSAVQMTPRIGIQYAGEPWVSLPWRFVVLSPHLSLTKGSV